MLDAGKLRHRITILQPDSEQDSDTGELETVWSELATVWASWEPLKTYMKATSVKDFISASSIQNQISVRSAIRYRNDVLPNFRVRKNSVEYDIVGPPLPDKESGLEYLTLMLAEVTDE
jgi:SPP1 family predicted phage head-tail adaptor